MAGYMTRLVGSDGIYEGNYKANEALTNGIFVFVDAGVVKKITATGDIIMKVQEKEVLWGKKAVRLDVQDQGAGTIYFVENVEPGDRDEYDDIDPVIKSGAYVRMHKPLTGEQLIMHVTDEVYAALSVNDLVKPASGGSIAKYTP